MKTIIKSCALALAVGAMTTGCADFVNIIPKDLVTEDNFWDEKADVDQMVAGIYYKMQADPMMKRYIVWGELRSDNLYMGRDTQGRDGDAYEFLRENILSTNGYTVWTDFYNIINSCNQIIEMAPVVGSKDPTYTESNVNATIAEVTAIRSLMYFYLIRTFRDVPYYTYAIRSEDDVQNLPCTSFETILPELIADCERVLPSAIRVYADKESNTGRITQDAIHALLADMYLWQGDYAKCVSHSNSVISSFCDQANEKKGGSVVSMSGANITMVAHDDDPGVTYANGNTWRGYPLYIDGTLTTPATYYGDSFNTIFSRNGNSRETIFELAFTPSDGNAYVKNDACANFYGCGPNADDEHGILAPNKVLYESYNEDYFLRSDVRRYCLMEVDDEGNEGWIRKFASSYNDVEAAKTTSTASMPEANKGNYSLSSARDYDWIFYRLADVMLMKAEALVEMMLDEPANAADSVGNSSKMMEAFYICWAINKRSCMDQSKEIITANYPTKKLMQDLVQAERRKELMFEGKRWFDLVRIAYRKGTAQAVKDLAAAVNTKFTMGTGGSVLPNMESLFLPYNKKEVKLNENISQKPYWASQEKAETTESTAK